MAFDSTANLLFQIKLDSSDAQANIQRFRQLLTKDLDGMKAEFTAWSTKVFGEMSSAKSAMIAGASVAAAGILAAGAAIYKAAEHTAQFADEIDDGMDKTGLAAEEMSKLRFAAERTGVQYGTLVQSLVRFERSAVEAAAGVGEQADAFRRLGISQGDIRQGTENILPLLYRTMDAFRGQSSTTEKAAMAQALFRHGGAELLEFLSLGEEGLRQYMNRAQELGRVLGDQDVEAAKAFKIAMQELRAEMEVVWLHIGKAALPIMTQVAALMIATVETMKKDTGGPISELKAWAGFFGEWTKASDRLNAALEAARSVGADRLLPPAAKDKAKETVHEFEGLSQVLQQVRDRMASLQPEEAQIAYEANRMQQEAAKAATKLANLRSEGKVTAEDYKREMKALADFPKALAALTAAQTKELEEKRAQAIMEAGEDLQRRLLGFQEETYEARAAGVRREVELTREKLARERLLTEDHARLLAEIEAAALSRIQAERTEAFARQLSELQREQAGIIAARMTTAERIGFTYDQDRQKYSEVEEFKALKTAQTEGEVQAIIEQYALLRQIALNRYGEDLMALYNSQGWQGVFGDFFAQSIRGNEELLREWAVSADQALLMVRVAMESLDQTTRKAFGHFAQAMGQNIAQAFIYRKSIGEAMRAAAAETLAAIAAESIVQAIYATALGFIRLAQHDYVAAGEAFKAAALFGTVGAVAAVAGRAIAPKQGSAGAAAEGEAGAGARGTTAEEQQERGPRIQIVIQGHVVGASGIEELTSMINDAVRNRDVKLVASGVQNNQRLLR